jgi:hypothetical protein
MQILNDNNTLLWQVERPQTDATCHNVLYSFTCLDFGRNMYEAGTYTQNAPYSYSINQRQPSHPPY